MKAMILAAGLGTRLRPLSWLLPKPMVPLGNRPLIAWLVDALVRDGIDEIVVNVHHLPEPIERDLPPLFPHVRFHFSLEPEILGTGGGVRNVRALLERESDFFLLNGDSYQQPRFEALLRARRAHESIAALTLRHPPEGDRFTAVWLAGAFVTGFGAGTGEPLMFSGSHCISREIFRRLPDRDVSSIVDDVYRPLVEQGSETIAGILDDGPWFDIGTPRRYLAASRALSGGSAVGAGSVIEGELHDSIVWEDCFIGPGVVLESCIVASEVELRGPMHFRDAMICRDDRSIPRDAPYRFEHGLVIASI